MMSDQRRHELEALLAVDGQQADGSRIAAICAQLVAQLKVSGAGVTVLSRREALTDGHDPNRGLVYATDEISARLEDLQLTVGEGPCLEAFDSGGPVLVADLAAETSRGRWPAYAAAGVELGAAAVYSFPLQIGTVRLGSLDSYDTEPGELTTEQVTDALLLADLATQAVLAELDGHASSDMSWLADPHTQVHQATGMVRVQLSSSTEVALLRMRAHAYSQDQTLAETSDLVVSRQLRFTDSLEEGSL